MSPHHLTRWLFFRGLGLTHVVAFTSFWSQLDGLIGARGLAPAADRLADLQAYYAQSGQWAWAHAPTLAWLSASDGALTAICAVGGIAGLLLLLNLAPRWTLGIAWICALSLFTVSRPFLGYQWDILLLETSFLGLFYAPPGLRPRLGTEPAPPWIGRLALRLLLFKLIFSSGVVKLTSGDPTWRDHTALDYHFWSQPLPHGAAWYAHNVAAGWRALAVQITLAIEILAPFLIFANPRRFGLLIWLGLVALVFGLADDPFSFWPVALLLAATAWLDDRVLRRTAPFLAAARPTDSRMAAFWLITGLMVLISATGNYGFFQLLTITLCVNLLDDDALRAILPERLRITPAAHWIPRGQLVAAWFAAGVFLVGSAGRMLPLVGRERLRDAVAAAEAGGGSPSDGLLALAARIAGPIDEVLGPFAVANGYGLFATMTTRRDELIIEGTADGQTWKPYRFRYKPDDPRAAPPVVGLHMPRLDWQMWFSALRPRCGREAWFMTLLERLLQGEPAVLELLGDNPFPGAPPAQVRVRRASYRFSDPETRARTDQIWVVEPGPDYCPPLTLADFARLNR